MPSPHKPIRNELVVREYKCGIPAKIVAQRHGISTNRVYYILRRAGINTSTRETCKLQPKGLR